MHEKTPAHMGVSGRKLWTAVVGKWDLRPDELRVLEDASREADLVDDLERHLKGADRLVHGSMGQPVINPLISELRQHRMAFAGLMGKLKLPDDGAGSGADGTQQRAAAKARWNKSG